MIQIFCRKKGAISVFLSVILLPTLIVAFLAVDAARIYCAKVVVSDAGELAMNAALARYNAELKDEYGLIAMDKAPSAMQGELERYFSASLNGSGLDNAGGYRRMLDITEKSFEAIDIEASKLYKTEVEKQQILEYMKYRAPVCIAELVLEKLDQIKENREWLDAMDAEADFAEAMEECQDAFEEAKKALDALNARLESFPDQGTVKKELEDTWQDFTVDMSRAFLMRAGISHYDAYDTAKIAGADTTEKKLEALQAAAASFVSEARQVDLAAPTSQSAYDNYLDALWYKNTADRLGGVDKLLDWYDELHPADAEEGGPDAGERQALADLITDYNKKKEAIAPYADRLLSIAKGYVETHYTKLHDWRQKAGDAVPDAQKSYDKLKNVKKKLDAAAKKHAAWKEAASKLSDPGNMEKEIKAYENMFDTRQCEALMEYVETDKKVFEEIKTMLAKEKFFGQSIAAVSPAAQCNKYGSEADKAMRTRAPYDYTNVEDARTGSFKTNYSHTGMTMSYWLISIKNDPFYQDLIKYCESRESAEKNAQKKKANGKLSEGAAGSGEAKSEDGYPDYDWNGTGMALPSGLLGGKEYNAQTGKMTDTVGGNIDDKNNRKSIISKVKDSIHEASSFLDGLDRILSDGLENLYIAEYGMQMFTYYTVDKKVDEHNNLITLAGDDLASLSGYRFTPSSHKAFKAETEYILWGKTSSAKNVGATVMVIYGIRLLFNCIFALTDKDIDKAAIEIAMPWATVAPYLEPIIKLVFKFGLALCETASDIRKIKEGYGVAVIKDRESWVSWPMSGVMKADNTKGKFTLSYAEYLRIFLNISMLAGNERSVLARTADCIQVNTGGDIDITEMYTMLAIEASAANRTTFMRRIADWSGAGWEHGDSYTINYKSVLGY